MGKEETMSAKQQRSHRWWIPGAWIIVGLALGSVYGVVDDAFDDALVKGGPLAAFDGFHRAFNTIIPPIAGTVVGLLIAYMKQREKLLEAEKRANETIRTRLAGIERQQAVWLLASSLLHEIRGPLHAMGLLLEEIEDAEQVRGSPALAGLLSKASKQAEKIEERIASLRQLAESPAREKTKIDLVGLVQSIVSDVSEVARSRCVEVQVSNDGEPSLYANEWAIRTSIENLLTNAIEAASENATLKQVRVETQQEGPRWVIRISDSGKGISDLVQKQLFEPLQSGKRRGLGLGLPLSQALARHEHGDVKLIETGIQGTTFAYHLPLQTADGDDKAP